MRRTLVLVGTLLLALSLVVSGCGGDGDDQTAAEETATSDSAAIQAPAEIGDRGKIIYCTDPTYPVAEFMEGDEFKGFDIDIGTEIAERLGVEADWTVVGFDAIIPAVRSGRCDGILSALRITPERAEQVDFVPYMKVGVGLLVQKGNPKGIESFEDLSGKRCSVLIGSFNKDELDKLNERLKADGKPLVDIVTFPKDSDAAQAVRVGNADAYFSGMSSVAFYEQQAPDAFDVAPGSNFDAGEWGIAIEKGKPELQAALQQAVDALYEDGTIPDILERWGVPETALEQ